MMNYRQAKLKVIFSIIFTLVSTHIFGESFRVAKLHVINLMGDAGAEETVTLGINDALSIFLPEDEEFKNFIEGIEIKMTIPEQTALWNDCCACTIYEKINPVPNQDQIDFTGNKIFFEVLPGKLSWILQIPFSEDNLLKTNQYTTKLEQLPDLSNNFIFLRLQQIIKGIPDSVMNSKISMTVTPILNDMGLLKILLSEEKDGENSEIDTTIFIDDESVAENEAGYLLKEGIHNISIISENYRTEFRAVRIDQAKTTNLEIKLKSIEPTVIITTPENTEVFFDEEPCIDFGKEFVVSEGEHKVKFIIGDYEIIRSLSIIKGKTYKINLAVDLQISEE